VTGFEKDEITVEIDQHNLVVRGSKKGEGKEDSNYIYRGLANRDFTRFWELGEYIEVNEGRIKNGVLTIGLKRVVPEALKPRVLKLKSE
jgi:molecular chaperone IbpA